MPAPTVSTVQAMLTPAVAISAVGLLLLTLSNRYSAAINRIRLLSDERRRLRAVQAKQDPPGEIEQLRLESVLRQTRALLVRMRSLRNAVFCMYLAVGMFVLTSVGIGAQLATDSGLLRILATTVFLCGMLVVLLGVAFATVDLRRSFRVVELDAQSDG
ncbi:MAG: DUF2721 domain-containing protein [Proteobacteria bacterium]|nr:DUF2721 domain-containing protein [Pseudomonadota bacterium]